MKTLDRVFLYLTFWMVAALFAASLARAGTATLDGTPVTKNTDGSTITVPVTYSVFQGTQGQANKPSIVTGLTTPHFVVTLPGGTTVCFEMTAVAGGAESVRSNEGCKTIPNPIPNAPVLTVTVTAYERHNNHVILVGKVAVGVACGAPIKATAPSGADLYSIPRNKVTFTRKDYGTQTFGVCG